jgi:haloacetate dehalogenase
MGEDQFTVMRHLGFEQFAVVGHDRGGRVAHRMALDHPDRVTKVAVLDIAPTLTMYTKTNKEFATRYVWWFFVIQPEPLPERLIGNDAEFYLREHLKTQNKNPDAISDVVMSEYIRCYCCRKTIHAVCEDYRAAAGIGCEQGAEDDKAGNRVKPPLLALWGANGAVGQLYDVLATWKEKAENASGKALNCGHLLPEECPTETRDELLQFLRL